MHGKTDDNIDIQIPPLSLINSSFLALPQILQCLVRIHITLILHILDPLLRQEKMPNRHTARPHNGTHPENCFHDREERYAS